MMHDDTPHLKREGSQEELLSSIAYLGTTALPNMYNFKSL